MTRSHLHYARAKFPGVQNAALSRSFQPPHDILPWGTLHWRTICDLWIRCSRVAKGGAMDENTRSVRGYRARAKQIRDEAARMSNLATQEALLEIAAHYERLASRVELNRDSGKSL